MGIETHITTNHSVTNKAMIKNSQIPFVPNSHPDDLLSAQQATADQFNKSIYFSDTLKSGGLAPEVTIIPAGLFEMGSAPNEHGHHHHEAPQHYVSIRQPFAIGRYTVTADQFEAFKNATQWHLNPGLLWAKGKKPVMNIRISDAQLFTEWLSEETGETYRLPTEAEWEYATRAGSTTPFHFGGDASCQEIHCDPLSPYQPSAKKKWFMPRCFPMPVSIEVGSKPANLWGLHEVHGNVWEYTQSPWTPSHINANRDGSAATHTQSQWYVTKGGSWFDGAIHARSAARKKRYFDEMDTNLGFRVLRELG